MRGPGRTREREGPPNGVLKSETPRKAGKHSRGAFAEDKTVSSNLSTPDGAPPVDDRSVGVGGSTRPPTPAERLRAQADARRMTGKPWTPEVGDELVGVFRGWSSGVTRRNEHHRIALVEDEVGVVWAVWTFYTVLRAEFEQADPQPDEMLLVRRLEDRTGPNGRYRVFAVVVDREQAAAPPTDWELAGDSPGNADYRVQARTEKGGAR